VNKDIPLCPVCNAPTRARDSRKRLVKDSAGSLYTFRLRRLKCLKCGSVHLELPDCIQPQKHYFRLTIEKAKEDKKICAADDSTIRRWKK